MCINRGLKQNFCKVATWVLPVPFHDTEKMTGKNIKSIQELGEFFKYGNAGSNNELWGPFNRIFRVSMKSSRMEIPKKFEGKLSRWFHLPGDEHEEQSIKRAELQTVGWYSQILELELYFLNVAACLLLNGLDFALSINQSINQAIIDQSLILR